MHRAILHVRGVGNVLVLLASRDDGLRLLNRYHERGLVAYFLPGTSPR